jgi:hypothetical protein
MPLTRKITAPGDFPKVSVLSPDDMRRAFHHLGLYQGPVGMLAFEIEPQRSPLMAFPRPQISMNELMGHLRTELDLTVVISKDYKHFEFEQWPGEEGDGSWTVAQLERCRYGQDDFCLTKDSLELRNRTWRLPSIQEAVALFALLALLRHELAHKEAFTATYVSDRSILGNLMRVVLHRGQILIATVLPGRLGEHPHTIRFLRETDN